MIEIALYVGYIRPTGGATFHVCACINYNKGNDWIFKYFKHIPNNTKTNRIQCVRRARFCSTPNIMILQLRRHCIKNQFRCIMLHVSIIQIEYFQKCIEIHIARVLGSKWLSTCFVNSPNAHWIRLVSVSVWYANFLEIEILACSLRRSVKLFRKGFW